MNERDMIEAELRKELRISEMSVEDVRRRATGNVDPVLLAMQVRALHGSVSRLLELANELKGYAAAEGPRR